MTVFFTFKTFLFLFIPKLTINVRLFPFHNRLHLHFSIIQPTLHILMLYKYS